MMSDQPEPADSGETFPRDYVEKLRREIETHRNTAREARDQVETLTSQIGPYRAAQTLATLAEINDTLQPGGLLVDIAELADRGLVDQCLDETGHVDPATAAETIRRLAEDRPHLQRRNGSPPAKASLGEILARGAGR